MIQNFEYLYAWGYRKLVKEKHQNSTCFGKTIYDATKGNEIIKEAIKSPDPCVIGRIGTIEMGALNAYMAIKLGLAKHLPESYQSAMYNNTGLFPNTEEVMFQWGELYLDLGKELDIFATFGRHTEDYFVKQYTNAKQVIQLRSLEPYYHENPWSIALEGKKVLVVHPFEKSIQQQYQIREKLFQDPQVLPQFELKTVKAAQTCSNNTEGFECWFDALDYMKEKIDQVDYDIALIGCGAYALPLAVHAKKTGKKAIVTAGATQILFGISGKRWDSHPVISKLYNENWKRPDVSETPHGAVTIEGGCYW